MKKTTKGTRKSPKKKSTGKPYFGGLSKRKMSELMDYDALDPIFIEKY